LDQKGQQRRITNLDIKAIRSNNKANSMSGQCNLILIEGE